MRICPKLGFGDEVNPPRPLEPIIRLSVSNSTVWASASVKQARPPASASSSALTK